MEMSDFTPSDMKEHHPSAISLRGDVWPGADCILNSCSDGLAHFLRREKGFDEIGGGEFDEVVHLFAHAHKTDGNL